MPYIKCTPTLTRGPVIEYVITDEDCLLPLQIKCTIAYTAEEWWLETIDEVNLLLNEDELPFPMRTISTEKQRKAFIEKVKAALEWDAREVEREIELNRSTAA